jgi:hypothetical protein
MTNPPTHLKQQKITYFFRRLPRSVQPNPTRQNCSLPKATPPPIAQKRNKSLRRHLLTYKKPTRITQPLTSFTKPLPNYKLTSSWGHSLSTINANSTFRVFLQNPNGLPFDSKYHSLHHDFLQCRNYGAAVECLPEANVNWDLPEQRQSFYNLLYKTWKASVSCTSKAPEEFEAPYQPGGTATIICDNWTSRVLDKGEDPVGLGQWTYITLQGKGTKKVTVVTAYNASYTTGGTTNFCQQQRVLTNLHIHHKQVTEANPRKQFILDLQSWLEHQLTQNHEIILAMEANMTYDPDIIGQA